LTFTTCVYILNLLKCFIEHVCVFCSRKAIIFLFRFCVFCAFLGTVCWYSTSKW